MSRLARRRDQIQPSKLLSGRAETRQVPNVDRYIDRFANALRQARIGFGDAPAAREAALYIERLIERPRSLVRLNVDRNTSDRPLTQVALSD